MIQDFFKMMCKVVLALYIGVVITYMAYDVTHKLFNCKLLNEKTTYEYWDCNFLHIVTLIAIGTILSFIFLIFFLDKDKFSKDN